MDHHIDPTVILTLPRSPLCGETRLEPKENKKHMATRTDLQETVSSFAFGTWYRKGPPYVSKLAHDKFYSGLCWIFSEMDE